MDRRTGYILAATATVSFIIALAALSHANDSKVMYDHVRKELEKVKEEAAERWLNDPTLSLGPVSGWEMEEWHCVDVTDGETRKVGYFKDLGLAKAFDSSHSTVSSSLHHVKVLTRDGEKGYIVSADIVRLVDESKIKDDLIARAKEKLSRIERSLLGID